MYTRVEQIGVYVIENDNQILHYQRKKLQRRNVSMDSGAGLELKVSA